MAQGFLQAFVLGFLLTAMPAFLHGGRARWWESAIAASAMAVLGASALAGWWVAAQCAYLVSVLMMIAAGVRRLPHRRGDPAEEFLFVAVGFGFALAAGVWSVGAAAGWWDDPRPRFALHLITEGMMLSVVLGIGGLLVPAFTSMRKPLFIPGIARPGERRPRRILYVTLASLLVVAMILEALGHSVLASWIRLIPGVVMTLLVWKLFQRPGRVTPSTIALWGGGWLVLAGLILSAAFPPRSLLGFHLLLLGGFGLLIQGIATRVVVSHGGKGIAAEALVLRWDSVGALMLALAARAGAELAPSHASMFHALAALFWMTSWTAWGWRALTRMFPRRRKRSRDEGCDPRAIRLDLSAHG